MPKQFSSWTGLAPQGKGLNLWDSRRACSKGYHVTFDPKLHRERKPADDYFLFLHLVLLIKLNPQGLSGVAT